MEGDFITVYHFARAAYRPCGAIATPQIVGEAAYDGTDESIGDDDL